MGASIGFFANSMVATGCVDIFQELLVWYYTIPNKEDIKTANLEIFQRLSPASTLILKLAKETLKDDQLEMKMKALLDDSEKFVEHAENLQKDIILLNDNFETQSEGWKKTLMEKIYHNFLIFVGLPMIYAISCMENGKMSPEGFLSVLNRLTKSMSGVLKTSKSGQDDSKLSVRKTN